MMKKTTMKKKLKIGFFSQISEEWFPVQKNRIEQINNINDADYIIFEANGDPIPLINKIKTIYPKNKLVFILSGDQNSMIDDECIWFTNAVKPEGLAKRQTQIFVTNPAIFKFYENNKNEIINGINGINGINNLESRYMNVYFKGTIWSGMRTDMFNFFKDKPNCVVENNTNYWGWRFNALGKPTQEDVENKAFESYDKLMHAKLCLCPRGNGNSSMRIIEAIACGSIPILINDFSKPFGLNWNDIGLVFDTNIHKWDYIYEKCNELIYDVELFKQKQRACIEFFIKYVFGDANGNANDDTDFPMYKDINTVCYGFSNMIIDKLFERFERFEKYV